MKQTKTSTVHLTLGIFLVFFSCLSFCFSQTGHWENLNPQHHPSTRASHGMAQIGKNKVLLFGGSYTSDLNDTWMFDLEKNDWQEIICNNPPAPRDRFGMCQITEKQVLLFGGSNNGAIPVFNDLWLFDLDSMDWTELKPQGWNNKYFPLPTFRLGMAKLTTKLIVIYGGQLTDTSNFLHSYSDDTWIYHIDKNEWEWRNIGWPSARSDLMMAELDNDLVLMCGGNKFGFYNDSWYYVQDNYYWFEFKDLKNKLPLIMSAALSGIGNRISILFGGHSDPEESPNSWYDSTWVFDYYGRTWTKLDINPHPSDRLRSRMASIDTKKALLFGGASQTNKKPEDTWLFVLDSLPSIINENNSISKSNLQITYLNPNQIKVDYSITGSGKVKIDLIGLNGDVLKNVIDDYLSPGSYSKDLNLVGLPVGIYFIRLQSMDGVLVGKVMKME